MYFQHQRKGLIQKHISKASWVYTKVRIKIIQLVAMNSVLFIIFAFVFVIRSIVINISLAYSPD